MIQVEQVTLRRSGVTVCRDVSLDIRQGEVTVILGANGSGKSALLEGIAGLLPVDEGRVLFDNEDITRMPAHRRAQLGISMIDQSRSVFSKLTVAQNIAVVDRSKTALANAFEQFPQLSERRNTAAGRLSGGEQQMLLIARALATKPRILLVDELSLGLAPTIVRDLLARVADLAAEGMGVVLVEQFADLALSIGHSGHVMHQGTIVRSASAEELLTSRSDQNGGGSPA